MRESTITNKAAVRDLIDRYVTAVRNHDIDGVLSAYAPEFVAFDLVPPLQYAGAEAFGKVWRAVFEMFENPIPYEVRDLEITAGDDVAFSHSLNWNGGTMKNGRKIDQWLRWTAGYKKIDGQWRIAHVHVSVPVDFQSGKAVVNLKP